MTVSRHNMLEAECSAYAFDMRCDEMVGISSITRYGTVGSCVADVVATGHCIACACTLGCRGCVSRP